MLSTPSLYYFQDLAYASQNPRIFTQISDQDLSDRGIGLICRRACEYYLHWTPEEAVVNFTKEVWERMCVDLLIRRLRLPNYYSPCERTLYLYQLMYPELFSQIDHRTSVIRIYQTVLSGQLTSFPRAFLSGGKRKSNPNACYCLIYALQTYGGCRTEEAARQMMSGSRAIPFLREVRLYDIYQRKYRCPVTFVDDAIRVAGWR